MPTKELEVALEAAKWGNAERDLIDVVARVLEAPENLVERVLYAAGAARTYATGRRLPMADDAFRGVGLSQELARGIAAAVYMGMARAAVRSCIEYKDTMRCGVDTLIADCVRICEGCPISLHCVAHSLSSPSVCFDLGLPAGIFRTYTLSRSDDRTTTVTPLKIDGDTVTVSCEHPKGTYQVQAKDLTA